MDNKEKLPATLTDYGRRFEKNLEKMSPFEIKNKLMAYAKESNKNGVALYLNAGRGNPNWVSIAPREAFGLLVKFGLQECRYNTTFDSDSIGGVPRKEGIASRLFAFLGDCDASRLLRDACDYMTACGIDGDEFVYEWVSGAVGDQYPNPDRMLSCTEKIVADYLSMELCGGASLSTSFLLFATEGGTAAMCYLFNTLKANYLLKRGDRIALMTPIFTPYIEIPHLSEFGFEVIQIKATAVDADGLHTWQYPDSELDKLKDTSIKLLCLVNPSNPPSYAIDSHAHKKIAEIVRQHNPQLMIISDDVYSTFVPGFRSLMAELPFNTACVYSFSKYFGCTGWRLAVVAMATCNIFDTLLRQLSEGQHSKLQKRYQSITDNVPEMKFIDRLVADSRLVALNHTAGLSTPQQVQMGLFAISSILDTDSSYKKMICSLITQRLEAMWDATGFTLLPDPLRAGYYSEVDILLWAEKRYGRDFAQWLQKNYEPLDFVIRLAKETGIVLLNGSGFDAPKWSVRASLANLDKSDYQKIGEHIGAMLDEYASQWYPDA